MLYQCFASFKKSPIDFFKLVESRLILMLLMTLQILLSVVFTNHLWVLGVIGQKK